MKAFLSAPAYAVLLTTRSLALSVGLYVCSNTLLTILMHFSLFFNSASQQQGYKAAMYGG